MSKTLKISQKRSHIYYLKLMCWIKVQIRNTWITSGPIATGQLDKHKIISDSSVNVYSQWVTIESNLFLAAVKSTTTASTVLTEKEEGDVNFYTTTPRHIPTFIEKAGLGLIIVVSILVLLFFAGLIYYLRFHKPTKEDTLELTHSGKVYPCSFSRQNSICIIIMEAKWWAMQSVSAKALRSCYIHCRQS